MKPCYLLFLCSLVLSCAQAQKPNNIATQWQLPDQEWKMRLSPEEYAVLRKKGTERAFTGQYWNKKDPGLYRCRACNTPLFSSETKYESGSGWPSFWQPLHDSTISISQDLSLGMLRDEVLCAQCGGHLGHVFPDGPRPTGLRYCLNSVSLSFEPKREN
ncbi:MAG: peptide-methionine (R)-S-oxide reductase MsrB [Cyclobacteriaceae bacterium]|nr:peptide-methionine (R)-S-oxide reductase MsrB [Cyclobacteriaceae bacterium]